MIKPVVSYPSKLLRVKALTVTEFTDELKTFCKDLADTMEVATGAGIAAPQIGSLARVFVINKAIAKTKEHVVFINPTIDHVSLDKQSFKEGCLSFYGIFFDVERPSEVTVTYQDVHGQPHTVTAAGYYAQAIQHEYDHLEGRLFIDHAGPVRRELVKRKYRKFIGKDDKTKYLDYRECQPSLPPSESEGSSEPKSLNS